MSISLRLRSSHSGKRNPSLKLPALAKQRARRGLAQASPSHSDERPSLRRALEIDMGELMSFSLRRELLA
ncbi:hypothetical protein DEO72_LG6g662 [Vigna unguiculata]|uniref:Uncharacterized protein n=1 Tax=Vigna unguiculata TaxID=3917 RepID=A0A4D6M7V8_VIGUN|nr:hypothetical protein DEO72_LG6g662 [Vigna unguiculata]